MPLRRIQARAEPATDWGLCYLPWASKERHAAVSHRSAWLSCFRVARGLCMWIVCGGYSGTLLLDVCRADDAILRWSWTGRVMLIGTVLLSFLSYHLRTPKEYRAVTLCYFAPHIAYCVYTRCRSPAYQRGQACSFVCSYPPESSPSQRY